MIVGGFAQLGVFSDSVCPYCWQSVDAIAPVIEKAPWRPMFSNISADVAGYKGTDRIVGVVLLPCGHRVASYFWHATESESNLTTRATMVLIP